MPTSPITGQPYTSPLEDAARLRKATRLADAFEAHARQSNPDLTAPQLAGLAAMATDALWADVAELAGIRSPSARTIALARTTFTIRAEHAGTDPFAGLPR